MSEEFRVDGALGYAAAVYGNVALGLAKAVVMYDARYNLLACTAFALDEYTQVGTCHLESGVQCHVQFLVATNNVVSCFQVF